MSQENVESVNRANDAANRGDVEAVLKDLDPNIELHAFMEELLGGEGEGLHMGHAGVREFFRDFNEPFDQLHCEYPDVRDLGDRVLRSARSVRAAERAEPRSKRRSASWSTLTRTASRLLSVGDPVEALEAAPRNPQQ